PAPAAGPRLRPAAGRQARAWRRGAGTVSEVGVVIVNYRTPALAVDCLRSLAAEAAGPPRCRAVVVDNGSGDGSAAALAGAIDSHGWRPWAELLPLGRNGGFAAGNNAALR